jgi:hypothetical protein
LQQVSFSRQEKYVWPAFFLPQENNLHVVPRARADRLPLARRYERLMANAGRRARENQAQGSPAKMQQAKCGG